MRGFQEYKIQQAAKKAAQQRYILYADMQQFCLLQLRFPAPQNAFEALLLTCAERSMTCTAAGLFQCTASV